MFDTIVLTDEQIALKQMLKAQRHLSLHKENELEEYDPWGRPGGGAPIRTQSGNVVADYKKRHQGMSSKNDENVTSVPPAFNLSSKMMTTTESYTTHDVITTETPVAMRSSFAVGAPGVVKYESYQSKIDEKKKWLQDIEQQIKEKKERQAQEKMLLLQKEGIEESWNQRPVISNESPPGPTIAASTTKPESPFNVRASVAHESSFRAGNVHVRGHGLHSLGGVNQDEFERKRLKTLEHQLAIKEQVEEKRRLKQEEKERRLKDEAEKEKALTLERERLQNQYKEELQLREDKEVSH
ncbi:post-embryonic retina morphogenesis in camera-type eye [Desmophyllum pertusum]|uniref:Post-embryonic retina morphogenesis in camera-type eye n=1 Tax=Desmophyllum pertusum TaxID=174260 RepID=A0A9W9ZDR8_9CNID|nr:post-embryonic retina morphogenesis in camera-type eye [Desmophyllum pertusum]